MRKIQSLFAVSLLSAVLLTLGCDSDSINHTTDDEQLSEDGQTGEENGQTGEENGQTGEENGQTGEENGQTGENGQSSEDEDLPGKDIDDEGSCPEACEENAKRCGETGVEICKKLDNGCIDWETEKTCQENEICDAEKLDCVAGCSEICEEGQSFRCTEENTLEECKPNEAGCAQWALREDCGTGQCDSEVMKCVKETCTPECTKGEKKCVGNGIATCIDLDGNGCTAWGTPEMCQASQTCESAKCTNKCTSNCTAEGATQDFATTRNTCKKTAEGCLVWQQTTKCGRAEKNVKGKCTKVCGSDCKEFSIVFLPDTQEYTRKVNDDGTKTKGTADYPNPDVFADQLLWVSDKRKELNIKAVIHLGDITDDNTTGAWRLASKAYKKHMDDNNKTLPYLVIPGNHDFLVKNKNDKNEYKRYKSQFSTYFNASRFKGRSWFGGFYTDTKKTYTNAYIKFKAGGVDFLVIGLEYAPRKEAVDWANDLISKHKNHKVIIESHAYLKPAKEVQKPDAMGYYNRGFSTLTDNVKAELDGATTGQYLYDNLVSKHNNIILVVNGHHVGSSFRLNKGKAGNVLGEMIVDYQHENGYKKLYGKETRCGGSHYNGGAGIGLLRVLHFNPNNGQFWATTHSSLSASRFYKGEKRMYCNTEKLYPADYSKRPAYNITADGTHNWTNYHAFLVTGLDFAAPVDYKFTK